MKEERKVVELRLDDVLPNRFQPRIRFDEEAINGLAESIKEHGVLVPIIVRPMADKYEIIAGERRYKASVVAGKTTIPAIVIDLNDNESAQVALIENIQRQNLTPMEEAVSYQKILNVGNLTQTQLAEKLGKDQSTIANKLRLLNLDEEVQEALLDEKISERHARSLLKLQPKEQKELLHKIITQRLTVRKTDEEINKILNGEVASTNEVETPKEREVLDITPEMPKVEELPQNFNIPDTPIIEEPSTPSTNEVLTLDEPTNPGFMDINKIEATATDIYQEKPLADVDSLLEPSTIAPAPAVETNYEPEVETITPGRFFNFMNEETETKPQEETEEPLGMDAFSTNNVLETQTSITPEISTEVEPVEEPIETLGPTSEPLEENQPVENTNIEELPQEPVEEIREQPIDTLDFDESQDLELETVTPVENNPTIEPTIPDYSFELEDQPAIEETPAIETSQKEINVPMTGDLKTAINTVRDCVDTIEKLGFVVDTDEFDFEDMYQFIIKIDKK